jgi:hypothetical protein
VDEELILHLPFLTGQISVIVDARAPVLQTQMQCIDDSLCEGIAVLWSHRSRRRERV